MQTRQSPNLSSLHRLARQANIADFEHLSKSDLFSKLKDQFNLDRLKRAEARTSVGSKRTLQDVSQDDQNDQKEPKKEDGVVKIVQKKKIKRINKLDPIMFIPLKKNIYKFYRPNGSCVAFNVESLVDYIVSTGDFHEPETRIPFKDSDLEEIDNIVKKAGLSRPSVLELKQNPQSFADLKFRRDALLGLERCAGEIVTDILHIIETCDPDEAQMRLLLREFPSLADLYKQIYDAEPEYANQCMTHWKLFLRGPPNNPNEDYYGLVDICIHFMNSLKERALS